MEFSWAEMRVTPSPPPKQKKSAEGGTKEKDWYFLGTFPKKGMIPPGMDAPRGGRVPPPRPALWGRGGFPAPPRKNDHYRGEVAGQNKYPNLNFLQKRKEVMEQYYNTEQCPIQPVNRICKRK